MLLRNALTPQQVRKIPISFCFISVTGLYIIRKRRSSFQLLTVVHQQSSLQQSLVSQSINIFHGYSLNVSPDLATEEYLVILTNLFSLNPMPSVWVLNNKFVVTLIYIYIHTLYFSTTIVKAGAYMVLHLTTRFAIIYKLPKYWILQSLKIYKIVIA